jgi:outer membrane protein insertion porin family
MLMNAGSKLLGAVSVIALSATMFTGTTATMLVVSAQQAEAAVVRQIVVRGNRRIDEVTVRGYVNIEPGRSFNNADIDEGVKRLFATGLFNDVRVFVSGSSLVVELDERSVVNQVLFQGNRKIKDNALQGAVQLQPRAVFSDATLQNDVDSIRAAYERIGRSDVTIDPQIVDLGEGRINVVFNIVEGDRTKILSISFVGNSAFSDRRLSQVISTKRSNFLSFFLRDDIYDEDRLRADEEALRRFYYNRGYADFRVISSSAELDPATNDYQIVFSVEEGEKYTFGDVSIDSTVSGIDGERLAGLVRTRQGRTYSAENVEDTIIALTERVAGEGYAFAQVIPRGDRDFANRTIAVTYTIDQGPRAYIERIEIRGNDKTRDYVIRREFDLAEGDAFNQVLIQRAKKRLDALDFFESVQISTAPGSEPDRVIVIVDVAEKSTGEFSIGAGYSIGGNQDGPQFEGSITERNFLGRGQFVKFAVGAGTNNRSYSFSFTEPYFLGNRIAAGFDVFLQRSNDTNYSTERTGGTVRFGLPITNALGAQIAYNYVENKYTLNTGVTATSVPQIIINAASADSKKSSVSGTLTYNTIDDQRNPHSGIFATTTLEVAGLGGTSKFFSITGRASGYYTLSEEMDLVGFVTVGGGHIKSIGSGGLNAFDLFRNSSTTIRGFKANGFGPFDTAVTGGSPYIGSTSFVNASAEAQFPFPLLPESFGMRAAVFADAASYFGTDSSLAAVSPLSGGAFNLRASIGASLIWASPFGPLRFDYAVPVKKQPGDLIQNINFGIATKF